MLSDEQIRAITMSPNPYYEINHILLCWPPAANIRPSEVLRTLDELEKLRARVAELEELAQSLYGICETGERGMVTFFLDEHDAEVLDKARAALREPASEPRTG